LPSDHVISDMAAFQAAVRAAEGAARDGRLVTFGIVPTGPETGYGYIRAQAGEGVRAVAEFVEKPDAETAAKYLASGEYFWNSGMFLFRAGAYLAELERQQPAMLAACRAALTAARRDEDFVRLDQDAFAACPSDSIDYAVMEKTTQAAVLPIAVGWNDVGSWAALWEIAEQDGDGRAESLRGAEPLRRTVPGGEVDVHGAGVDVQGVEVGGFRCPAAVPVPGGGGGADGAVPHLGGPAPQILRQVAPGAATVAVAQVGVPTLRDGHGVVGVPDRRPAGSAKSNPAPSSPNVLMPSQCV